MPDAVTCSLLPTKMRELRAEWNSSGSIAAFDFGTGLVTASNIETDVQVFSGSLETRPDSFALDYQTAWAFGPIETGSVVSGLLISSWVAENSYSVATQTGSIFLTRENDAGDNWRARGFLFTYTGNPLQEIDLTFDQAGRAVICADRIELIGGASQSIVWLYRFVTSEFVFSPIATGSTPRVLLDNTIDTSTSDVTVFYIKSVTSEKFPELIFTTGSGIDGELTTSLCGGAISLSLSSYHISVAAFNEVGNFGSLAGLNASIGITGTFSVGVSSVGATVVSPDTQTNGLKVYDAGGSLIDSEVFLVGNSTGELIKDTRIISGNGTQIRSFRLEPGSSDYVAYDQIIVEPTASCTQGTFSTQQMYMRIQRELFLTESAVPLVEGRFQDLIQVIFGNVTGSVGSLDPEDAGLDGRLFGTSSACPQGLASGTISGSPCGVILPNVSQSILSASFIPRTGQILAGSGTNSPEHIFRMLNGDLSTRWPADFGGQAAGQRLIVNFQATESIGGFYMDIWNDEIPGTLDVSSATVAGGPFVSRSLSISGSDPLVCMFTASFDAVFLQIEMTSIKPPPTPALWGIVDLNFFDNVTAFSFDGQLTGSHTGTIEGFVSGCMTGTISHSGDFFGAATGTTSQILQDGDEFLYELFLEDVVKLTDSRVAVYVSRRNIDSGSNDLGEYKVNKFETILFPHQIIGDNAEDQWSSSVDLISSSVEPILRHSTFDIEFFPSMSMFISSGSSSLRTVLIVSSAFDIEFLPSMSMFIPSGSSSLRTVLIISSAFDIEFFQSMSLSIPSGSSSLIEVVTTHSIFDKDSFVSYSCDITSGSFEVVP